MYIIYVYNKYKYIIDISVNKDFQNVSSLVYCVLNEIFV